MEAAGVGPRELARRANLPPTTVYGLLKDREPVFSTMMAISAALGTSLDFLASGLASGEDRAEREHEPLSVEYETAGDVVERLDAPIRIRNSPSIPDAVGVLVARGFSIFQAGDVLIFRPCPHDVRLDVAPVVARLDDIKHLKDGGVVIARFGAPGGTLRIGELRHVMRLPTPRVMEPISYQVLKYDPVNFIIRNLGPDRPTGFHEVARTDVWLIMAGHLSAGALEYAAPGTVASPEDPFPESD